MPIPIFLNRFPRPKNLNDPIMADTQTNPSNQNGSVTDDPLSRLHKMSTTAGLGSGDYVAVNIVAVVAALLGVASLLAKLNNALLLIPLAGALCGIIALIQINHSNGTQTGRGLAIAGLVLSLAIGGFVIAQQAADYYRTQADQQEIASLVQDLGNQIKSKDFAKAYALFDGDFQERVPLDKFKTRLAYFESAQAVELLGHMTGMEWNGLLQFDTDVKTGSQMAGGVGRMTFEKKGEPARQSMVFRKIGSKWKVDAMPDLFPPPNAQGGQGAPPGGGQ